LYDFEKIRDEIELKVRQALRNYQVHHGTVDSSVFTLEDLGIKSQKIIQQQRDGEICNFEIEKAIEKVGETAENRTSRKERLALKWVEKLSSRGYYAYARLMKTFNMPIESPKMGWWNFRYFNPILSLINPGGNVSIAEGDFPVYAQVNITPDNLKLQGTGFASRLISSLPGGSTDDLLQANGKSGVTIDSLYLQGQSGVGRNLISLLGCDDSTVSRCYVKNAYRRGIAVIEPAGGVRNAIINNICYTSGYGSPASDAETIVCGGLYKSVIIGNRVYDSWQGGITLSDCYDSLVANNTVEDSDRQNMGYGSIDFEQGIRCILSNNNIEGTGRGVRISRGSSDNVIMGNVINTSKEGVLIMKEAGASPHNYVVGNTIHAVVNEAICILDTCTDCCIEGNNIRDSTVAGILVNADYTSIVNNTIRNCDGDNLGWPGIEFQDTEYSVASNNKIRGTGRGIRLWQGSRYNVVNGNSINTAKGGIRIDKTGGAAIYNLVIGNLIHPLAEEGIVIQDTCIGQLVKGNIVHTGQVAGILNNGEYTSVIGNTVFNCDQSAAGYPGIAIHDVNYCIINDNIVYDTEVTPTQQHGIDLNNVTYSSIIGNLARNNAVYGIQTIGTSDYNLIISNMCAGNLHATDDIVYSGANSKVAWNIGRYTPQGAA